ncbi:hypothetical protein AB1Y20_001073 [Prymnesium parvum]|uniref:E3 ubiquitin-protein ligase n=1 Tax=Prymnesium parvum TaxID=97485 RepID=A0AB34KA03_PRYPA
MSAPHGAYILSQLGESLAHCTDCSHSPRPLHHPAAFCQLVATMLDCSGTPPSAYLELHGWGVVLLTGFRVIVAVLCEPSAAAARHARLVAMRILHAFGKLHHDHASELDAVRRGEVEASLHAYTFHSATAALHAEEHLTLEAFRPFVHSVMRPLLLERSPASSWLAPLLEVGCVLRALLLLPSRHVEEEQILLDAQPPRPRALTHSAGPHTPAVWRELLAMARRVVHAHAGLPHALADAPAAAAAFPSVALCDGCLHLAVLPVHTAPAGACLAAFYHAPCGGARRPTRRRGGARLLAKRAAAAHGVDGDGALPVVDPPAELRSALATSARAIAAAFPHSAAEMRALLASTHPSAAAGAQPLNDACTGPLGLSAEAAATTAPTAPYGAEAELPPPATPTKSPACEALPLKRETASPLILEIQTPRGAQHTKTGELLQDQSVLYGRPVSASLH